MTSLGSINLKSTFQKNNSLFKIIIILEVFFIILEEAQMRSYNISKEYCFIAHEEDNSTQTNIIEEYFHLEEQLQTN